VRSPIVLSRKCVREVSSHRGPTVSNVSCDNEELVGAARTQTVFLIVEGDLVDFWVTHLQRIDE